MLIIPTIFLRGGQIANPAPEARTALPSDPRVFAEYLRTAGAEMVHVVDLDPPNGGPVPHAKLLQAFVQEFGLHCQLSSQIRIVDDVERYLQHGMARVILGPIAYQKPDFARQVVQRFPGHLGIEITVRNRKVVIPGWTVAANKTAQDYLEQFRQMGMSIVLYSDVNDEGLLATDNLHQIRELASVAQMPIIHNTDLKSFDELRQLLYLEKFGVMGTILNKSLYEGRFDLESLITMTKEFELTEESEESTLIPE